MFFVEKRYQSVDDIYGLLCDVALTMAEKKYNGLSTPFFNSVYVSVLLYSLGSGIILQDNVQYADAVHY